MIAHLRVFKLSSFEARGELSLAFGFWWHINPHVAYKKLMLQGYFLILRPIGLGDVVISMVSVHPSVDESLCAP